MTHSIVEQHYQAYVRAELVGPQYISGLVPGRVPMCGALDVGALMPMFVRRNYRASSTQRDMRT